MAKDKKDRAEEFFFFYMSIKFVIDLRQVGVFSRQ